MTSLGSMLKFFKFDLYLVIFFHTPLLDLLAKTDHCLPSNLWIHRMTFTSKAELSVFNRHIHFANSEILRDLIEPSLIPPTFIGDISFSHATQQRLFFLSYSLLQIKFRLILSKVSIAPLRITKMDTKKVRRLPSTTFESRGVSETSYS